MNKRERADERRPGLGREGGGEGVLGRRRGGGGGQEARRWRRVNPG